MNYFLKSNMVDVIMVLVWHFVPGRNLSTFIFCFCTSYIFGNDEEPQRGTLDSKKSPIKGSSTLRKIEKIITYSFFIWSSV
jgi:hypothetical protein